MNEELLKIQSEMDDLTEKLKKSEEQGLKLALENSRLVLQNSTQRFALEHINKYVGIRPAREVRAELERALRDPSRISKVLEAAQKMEEALMDVNSKMGTHMYLETSNKISEALKDWSEARYNM